VIEIVMPRLSDSMEEGTILSWLVEDGAMVRRGDELIEVETDKAAMVHVSDADGTLEILAPEGSTHPVGDTIGRLLAVEEAPRPVGVGTDGEPAEEPAEPAAARVDEGESTPGAGSESGARSIPSSEGGSTPAGREAEPAVASDTTSGSVLPVDGAREGDLPLHDGRIHASPVARRLAAELGVSLAAVSGSGPHGRIVRADVEAAAGTRQPGAPEVSVEPTTPAPATAAARSGAQAAPSAQPDAPAPPAAEHAPAPETEAAPAETAAPGTAKGAVTRVEPTRSQSLIARRMSESRATVPDFTLEVDVDASRLADIRQQLRELAGDGRAPTVGDLVTRACALSLRDHPQVNGAWRDGGFEHYERINVGVAVATDDGLVVPVIFDADGKDVHEIAEETAHLATRAREGTITPPELSGGTFSISNLGMFGVDRFTAVINPPQSAILAVGAMREVPVVHDGEVIPGSVMTLTLAVDHRAIYGAQAAKFLSSVRDRLAAPAALLG